MTIDDFVKIRKSAGLTPADMAEKIGVSARMVHAWERGTARFNPSRLVFEKIMEMDTRPKVIKTTTTTVITIEDGSSEAK